MDISSVIFILLIQFLQTTILINLNRLFGWFSVLINIPSSDTIRRNDGFGRISIFFHVSTKLSMLISSLCCRRPPSLSTPIVRYFSHSALNTTENTGWHYVCFSYWRGPISWCSSSLWLGPHACRFRRLQSRATASAQCGSTLHIQQKCKQKLDLLLYLLGIFFAHF